jgi:predicted TIM-barrel fold metal-dependent hydrolase
VNDFIADIHCHNFNGDDLPLEGFVFHVGLHEIGAGPVLARLVDRVVQGRAPGFEAENAILDSMLSDTTERESLLLAPDIAKSVEPEAAMSSLDDEVDAIVQRLQYEDPALLAQVGTAVTAAYQPPEGAVDLEAFGLDFVGATTRAVKWATLFTKYRHELARLLIAAAEDRVSLLCPMLVDLDKGLNDSAPTTLAQQMVLQEKISRLSMQDRLGTQSGVRIHPFIAFDPVRQALSGKDVKTPLDLVQSAIMEYGFVGVKVYPPMGWRPTGNADLPWMTNPSGAEVDAALVKLYDWCVMEQVPITAHCNSSNYASPKYEGLPGPAGWIEVLQQYPDLHINLGHFGGGHEHEAADGWAWTIAAAMNQYDHLYADLGNHPVYDAPVRDGYRTWLVERFDDASTDHIVDHLMFGSDWYMDALHPRSDHFLDDCEALYENLGDAQAKAKFLGDNARSFLGFDDAGNRNAMRLAARYEQYHVAPPSWLKT